MPPIPPPRLISFKRAWIALLNLGFSLLCIRFLFAASQAADWTLVLLSTTGFGLAWWRPSASMFALILSFTLLSGLGQTVFTAPYSPLLVIASSMWLGVSARKLLLLCAEEKHLDISASTSPISAKIVTVVDLLATMALMSLSVQIWQNKFVPDFWPRFWHQATHGPGDPFYFLTSAFVWLHGLFYFRAVREYPESGLLTPWGIKLTFFVNGITLLFFFGLQGILSFPVRWNWGFGSPYEDIATFGIMAACLLILCLALWRLHRWPLTFLLGLGASLLAIALCASWSRGAWLAATVFIGTLALLRLPRYFAVLIPIALLAAVVGLNLSVRRISLVNRPFLERLMTLVRFEDPWPKHSARLELYHRALGMINRRPLMGHGIGSFYSSGTSYARASDPNLGKPVLPHNIFLQLATEQGVPVAILFAYLVGTTLWNGARYHFAYCRLTTTALLDRSDGTISMRPLALALTLALGAYLQANLTWDILLVHPTQPFFFWFLIAALGANTVSVISGAT